MATEFQFQLKITATTQDHEIQAASHSALTNVLEAMGMLDGDVVESRDTLCIRATKARDALRRVLREEANLRQHVEREVREGILRLLTRKREELEQEVATLIRPGTSQEAQALLRSRIEVNLQVLFGDDEEVAASLAKMIVFPPAPPVEDPYQGI